MAGRTRRTSYLIILLYQKCYTKYKKSCGNILGNINSSYLGIWKFEIFKFSETWGVHVSIVLFLMFLIKLYQRRPQIWIERFQWRFSLRAPLMGVGSQEIRFQHFLALAPEVDKVGPRKSDFSIFWPWFQKSTKWVPGDPILAFSGLGSRSRQNGSQEVRF